MCDTETIFCCNYIISIYFYFCFDNSTWLYFLNFFLNFVVFVCCTFSLFCSLACCSVGGLVAGIFSCDDSLVHLIDLGLVQPISLVALEFESRCESIVIYDYQVVFMDEFLKF